MLTIFMAFSPLPTDGRKVKGGKGQIESDLAIFIILNAD
jgi:hypothetical protein